MKTEYIHLDDLFPHTFCLFNGFSLAESWAQNSNFVNKEHFQNGFHEVIAH